jgi:hypothetical protein
MIKPPRGNAEILRLHPGFSKTSVSETTRASQLQSMANV